MIDLSFYQALYDSGKTLNAICAEYPEAKFKRYFLQTNLKMKSKSESLSGKPGWRWTQEQKDRQSIVAKRRGFGGHTSKQKLYFKKKDGTEVYLQSSYEIRYATLLEENDIVWTRPNPLQWIDSTGESHKYYGDFYLTKFDLYIDTKNDYLIIKDAEKIKRVTKQNNINLKVLSSRELDWLPTLPV